MSLVLLSMVSYVEKHLSSTVIFFGFSSYGFLILTRESLIKGFEEFYKFSTTTRSEKCK